MVTLTEAIESAKVISKETDGKISQDHYNRLRGSLPFEDQYLFTMALVELGITPRVGSKYIVGFLKESFEETNKDLDEIIKVMLDYKISLDKNSRILYNGSFYDFDKFMGLKVASEEFLEIKDVIGRLDFSNSEEISEVCKRTLINRF